MFPVCPGGGIGRHKGLKIPRQQWRAGSSPAPGTNKTSLIQSYVKMLINFGLLMVYPNTIKPISELKMNYINDDKHSAQDDDINLLDLLNVIQVTENNFIF